MYDVWVYDVRCTVYGPFPPHREHAAEGERSHGDALSHFVAAHGLEDDTGSVTNKRTNECVRWAFDSVQAPVCEDEK